MRIFVMFVRGEGTDVMVRGSSDWIGWSGATLSNGRLVARRPTIRPFRTVSEAEEEFEEVFLTSRDIDSPVEVWECEVLEWGSPALGYSALAAEFQYGLPRPKVVDLKSRVGVWRPVGKDPTRFERIK